MLPRMLGPPSYGALPPSSFLKRPLCLLTNPLLPWWCLVLSRSVMTKSAGKVTEAFASESTAISAPIQHTLLSHLEFVPRRVRSERQPPKQQDREVPRSFRW